MLDQEDLKWIAANATELNRRLHTIARCADRARERPSAATELQLLESEVSHAAKASQALFDRITSRILAGVAVAGRASFHPPQLKVLPSPAPDSPNEKRNATAKIPAGEVTLKTSSKLPTVRNPSARGELIMVVDDEPEILERAAEMLAEEDYRVIVAENGFDALQIYQRMDKEISLIILDFFLPVMDGDAVFDELKAINPKVQVVLSSGFAEQTKLGSMLARGLCGFIPKPYTPQKLIEQVRAIIAA